MRARFGYQHWWPAETRFEICLGAILTQNTQWTHVERALQGLKAASLLQAQALHVLPVAELASYLRPAGCPSVKARRVKAFLQVLVGEFDADLDRMFAGPVPKVRDRLLAIHGVGPETADCLLLYAGRRPSFVVDTYTRRILSRHGWCRPDATYGEVQRLCAHSLVARTDQDLVDLWQDCHAPWVMVGKLHCRPRKPACQACPLGGLLENGEPALPDRPKRSQPKRMPSRSPTS